MNFGDLPPPREFNVEYAIRCSSAFSANILTWPPFIGGWMAGHDSQDMSCTWALAPRRLEFRRHISTGI